MRLLILLLSLFAFSLAPPPFVKNEPFSQTQSGIMDDRKELVSLLSELAEKEKNPLMKRHFESVVLMTQDTSHGLTFSEKHLESVSGSLEFFKGAGAQWETYQSAPRPLVMAFSSPTDGKNSYYWLFLPEEYTPDRLDFPFYLELHGSGGGQNNPPWHMLYRYLQPEERKGTAQMNRREGFLIYPWGRGDKGYRDTAETDIWECLADFDAMFHTDPNRQFIYGFSMGGGGTYRLSQKSPDRWAAVGMYSAAFRTETLTRDDASTFRDIPVWMTWGETERWRDGNLILRDNLLASEVEVSWREVEGVGHSYLYEYQDSLMDWFLLHPKP